MQQSLTLKERSKKGSEILSNQPPVTLQEAQEQVKELKQQGSSKRKLNN